MIRFIHRAKRLLQRQSPAQPAANSLLANSKLLTQFSDAARNSKYCKISVCAFISVLLLSCFPSHVSRFIVPVVVNSSDCHFRTWPISYIVQELLKGMPLRTHPNAPPSIILEVFAFRIFTPINHAVPNFEDLSDRSASSVSVFEKNTIIDLFSYATTGFSSAESQTCETDYLLISTLAEAHHLPLWNFVFTYKRSVFADYFKLSKGASDDREFCRHNDDNDIVLFSDGRPAVTGAHCEIIERSCFEINNKRNS